MWHLPSLYCVIKGTKKMGEINKLVIVGNGFDIAHGLPTKYYDFMRYLLTYEQKPKIYMDNYIFLDSISQHDQAKHRFYEAICKYIPEQELWHGFEEALGILDVEQLKEDNACFLLGYGDEDWRDSAHHDFQYMIKEALSFASDIPHYLKEWIKTIDTSNVAPNKALNFFNSDCLFLTFNYTDTIKAVYHIPEKRILYIHGNALCEDDLISGHHDKTLFKEEPIPQFESDDEMETYYSEDIRVQEGKKIIKEYFRETYKNTSSIIRKNQDFFYSLKTINEIIILGHSLSQIDLDYFLEIRKFVLPTCHWHISYHNNNDFGNANNFAKTLKLRNFHLFYF